MTASLIKKVFLPLDTATPIPVMTDTLPYHEEIKCSRCEQVYTMGLPSAQDRLVIWRMKAQAGVNESHANGHELLSLPLSIPTMAQQQEYTRVSGLLQQICIRNARELPPRTTSVVLTVNNQTVRVEAYDGSKSLGFIPNATTSTFFIQDLVRAFSRLYLPEEGVIAIVSNSMSAKAGV
jgi:hypothetical protein